MTSMPQPIPRGTRLVTIGPPERVLVKEEDCYGPLAVVHSRLGLEVGLVEPQLEPAPPRGGYLIKLCMECEARPHLEEMDDGWTALALIHEPSCGELRRMLRKAGEDG